MFSTIQAPNDTAIEAGNAPIEWSEKPINVLNFLLKVFIIFKFKS